ncbi:MAG: peptidoglycan DD-metalloendopeptidase family protein, partial [Gemmatimonadales bacterium]
NHRVVKRIDPRGKVDSLTYDGYGRLIRTQDAAGNVSLYWYGAYGLVDSTRAPGETLVRTFTYDATWKNLATVKDETGTTVTTNFYDGVGRLGSAIRRMQVQGSGSGTQYQWRKTTAYYNVASQVDSTVLQRTDNCTPCANPPSFGTDTNHVVRVGYRFDRAGRDSLRLNDRGIATLYLYDRLGRVVSRHPWTDSTAVKDSMFYDVAGNLKKTITRRGDTLTVSYDTRNRDTATVIPGVGTLKKVFGGPLDQLTKLSYASPVDSIGAVNQELRWGYDQRGRLKADTSYTSLTARSTTYSYDVWERASSITDPLGTWTTRYETNRSLPDTLLTPFADTLLYTYDARGRAIGPTIASNGPRQGRTPKWRANGDLDTLTTTVSSTTPWTAGKFKRSEADLVDDPVAITTVWTERHGQAGAIVTWEDSVSYDGWERMSAWITVKNGSVAARDSAFFDRAGNVRPSAAGTSATFDLVTNRLLTRLTSTHYWTYSYDRAGNLTQAVDSTIGQAGPVTWTYGYTALNQLRSLWRNGTKIARYGYDVVGRRIAKRVYSAASGGTVAFTRFVYHGDAVAFETDSVGTQGLKYTWGLGTDDLVGVRDASNTQYYVVQDKLRSVRGLVKRDGTWILNFSYSPYGTVIDSAGAQHSLLRYRWTGREYDAETGWYFHRSRYYDPAERRFVQEDPIGYGGGDNLYAYVGGQVLEATDPSGTYLKRLEDEPQAGPGLDYPGGRGHSDYELYVDGAPVPWGSIDLDFLPVEHSSLGFTPASGAAAVAARAALQTRYAHLSKTTVKAGEHVEQGQLIGYSGDTGADGQPHLHFETRAIIDGNGVRNSTSIPLMPDGILYQFNGTNPLRQMVVTSGFGMRDLDKDGVGDSGTHNGYRMHDGFDYEADKGTPVYAAFSGTVVISGWVKGYGNVVYINH